MVIKICDVCGMEFEAFHNNMKRCSEKCSKDAIKKRRKLTRWKYPKQGVCIRCGSELNDKKHKLCNNCENDVVNDFLCGYSKVNLAKKYNISDRAVGLIIERSGNKQPKEGLIYFIMEKHGEFVKIGQTRNTPDIRMRDLQVGNPRELILLGTIKTKDIDATEARIHHLFKEYRYNGEWFFMNDEIEDFAKMGNMFNDTYCKYFDSCQSIEL